MVTGIIDALKNDSTVAGLVGDSKLDVPKIYPVASPQREQFPFIVVKQTSGAGFCKMSDFEGSCDVVAYTDNYDKLGDFVDAIIEVLEPLNNAVINSATLANVQDSFEMKANGVNGFIYCKILTYTCVYTSH